MITYSSAFRGRWDRPHHLSGLYNAMAILRKLLKRCLLLRPVEDSPNVIRAHLTVIASIKPHFYFIFDSFIQFRSMRLFSLFFYDLLLLSFLPFSKRLISTFFCIMFFLFVLYFTFLLYFYLFWKCFIVIFFVFFKRFYIFFFKKKALHLLFAVFTLNICYSLSFFNFCLFFLHVFCK